MTKRATSSSTFARKPRPWYKRATAAFRDPRGGIPVARVIHREVDCGPFIVTFLEPSSAFGDGMGTPDSVQVSLQPDTFTVTNLGTARAGHQAVDLGVSNWIYGLPRWQLSRILPVPHPPYAVITAHWQLERVKHGIQIDRCDLKMLEDYMRHDYTSHLESEGGFNWNMRKEAHSEKTLSGAPLSQSRIDDTLRYSLLNPPVSYEILESNGLHWLRYFWEPRGVEEMLIYTTIVLPDLLLTVSFHIGRMNSEPKNEWWTLFLEDCDILVKTIVCQQKALPRST